MAFGSSATKTFTALPIFKGGVRIAALSGAATLTTTSSWFQFLDPGGAHRDVTLPTAIDGMTFFVFNRADAAENLVIKNAQGDTICTINQNEQGEFYYAEELASANDADNWVLVCITTIALS